jgi:DNA-binding transcriptional regulator YhcF (GntR family)
VANIIKKMTYNKKLTKDELSKIAHLLRGRRLEIAKRANVHLSTVNNTFQDLFQNTDVIRVSKEMMKEILSEKDEDIEEIRLLIASK